MAELTAIGEKTEALQDRKPRPCTVCGEMQEPRIIEELNMVIHRPPVCEKCRGPCSFPCRLCTC